MENKRTRARGIENRKKRVIQLPVNTGESLIGVLMWTGWNRPWVRIVGSLLAAYFLFNVVTLSLDLKYQIIFAAVGVTTALLVRDFAGRFVALILIQLSILASTRYLYWRMTETMNLDTFTDAFFGIGLILAEIYAYIVLVLGYFQTSWPLERRPAPLPTDRSLWPTIDVFIPTYNEPLKVVRPTVLAAKALDWPADKLNVYILDDGRRDEFRAFAEEAGVVHVTRPDNNHAKAGNINHALKLTKGEYIAIFDCDHMPTRSFLQICLGWFLRDPKLSMMQTPHHFFSPDPFEKNLETFRRIPNEGELFYGLVQDGNDLWNATFFCGSCAVLKRAPVEEIGGIAVETVTEDAHTALKMHRLGYNTAYLQIPQAAGFATESLSAHVGQRIRWARGMAQIFRVDNPLLGPGLKIGQRLCYLNAMLHFFYGLPRIVFLTAPLAYLFFEAHVINAGAIQIASFALPHLMHASITNSRMQGKYRHSFWAEVYESVLAWYILRPTLVAVINPKLGKFNVTAKGGVIEKEYFDWGISAPYLIMLSLNVVGFLAGIGRLLWWNTFEIDTVILNMLWTIYNLVILGASVAVASEARQVRQSHRVAMRLPATIRFPNGHLLRAETMDYSDGGVGVKVPVQLNLDPEHPLYVKVGDPLSIVLYRGEQEFEFASQVVSLPNTRDRLGLQFSELTTEQMYHFVQCTFARADTWATWSDKRVEDKPLRGLAEVAGIGMIGFHKLGVAMIRRFGRVLFQPIVRKKI